MNFHRISRLLQAAALGGLMAVSAAALGGPDVWVDPTLFKSVFVSGRLGDALDEAGLRKAFRLYRSRVV